MREREREKEKGERVFVCERERQRHRGRGYIAVSICRGVNPFESPSALVIQLVYSPRPGVRLSLADVDSGSGSSFW